MTEFRRYVCWSPADVERVLTPMVESASDAAFLATHLSLPIVPEVSGHVGDREVVAESDVLEEFTALERDPALLAVVGPPGSGKSHIVRWLHANLAADEGRLVVYVPREETSLRRVLTRILDRLPGPEAARLRDEIESAAERLPPEHAAARVLDDIATQLEYDPPAAPGGSEQRADLLLTGGDGVRGAGLPTLLRDPAVRAALLAPGSVISVNVATAVSKYDSEDGTPRFAEKDLEAVANASAAPGSAAAQIARLFAPDADPRWRQLAAALLNTCLERGIRSLLGLGNTVSLTDVMHEARCTLAADGKELVVLIEDLALFESIGRSLFDALIVPATEGRCAMRTAFAITDDPFLRLPATLVSRIGLRFRTGVPLDDGDGAGIDLDRTVDFVGRYLNAVRVGIDGLERAFADAGSQARADGSWVPNACDGCAFRGPCHATEAFGETTGHHGLYPLGRAAAERLVRASLERGRFVPRTLLKALHPLTAVDAADLAAGKFPNRGFEVRVQNLPNARDDALAPVAAEVLSSLQDRGDADAERRVRLLRFWRPGRTEQASDLSATVHEAFDLPQLGVHVPPAPVTQRREAQPIVRDAPVEDPAAADIDRWLADDTFGVPSDLSGRLRNRLYELVMGAVRWNDELLSPKLPAVVGHDLVAPASFRIEDAAGGGRDPKPTALRFPLPRTAETAVLLKAVLRFDATNAFSSVADYVAIQSRVTGWADEVVAAIRAGRPGVFPADVAMTALVVASLALGADEPAYDDPVTAITEAVAGFEDGGTPVSERWRTFLASLSRADLEQLRQRTVESSQAAQGTGAVLGFDVSRYVEPVRALLTSFDLPAVPAHAPDPLKQLGLQLRTGLAAAVAEECAALLTLADEVDWETASDVAGAADAVLRAVDFVAAIGRLEGGNPQLFRLKCEAFAKLDTAPLPVLRDAAEDLRSESLALRLRGIRRCRPAVPVAAALGDFLTEAADRLERSLNGVEWERDRQLGDLSEAQARAAFETELARAAEFFEALTGETA